MLHDEPVIAGIDAAARDRVAPTVAESFDADRLDVLEAFSLWLGLRSFASQGHQRHPMTFAGSVIGVPAEVRRVTNAKAREPRLRPGLGTERAPLQRHIRLTKGDADERT